MRPLIIMAAVSALATLPWLLLALVSFDDVFERMAATRRRRWNRYRDHRRRNALFTRQERRCLARLDRSLAARCDARPEPTGPPIEKIATDLRRLRGQRMSIALRSPVWFAAVEKAYDERIRLACQRLGIDEHLDELGGLDREIERVRLEGELEAAGLSLRGCETASS